MLSFSSTSSPKYVSQGYSQSGFCPAFICAWKCPNPCAGPCTQPCWTSWGSYRPTSQASTEGPSGWYPFLPAYRPCNLVSLINLLSVALEILLRVPSTPLSMLLTKMLNSTGPNTNSQGTLLVTGLYLDITPLTATLWVWPSSQLLIQQVVHLSNPCLSNLETRMLCGTVSNALHKSS